MDVAEQSVSRRRTTFSSVFRCMEIPDAFTLSHSNIETLLLQCFKKESTIGLPDCQLVQSDLSEMDPLEPNTLRMS